MSEQPFPSLRIMIADDNDLVAFTLEEHLTELGHQIVGRAHTGHEAIELAQRLKPDLVFMDVRMPELEGPDAALQIYEENPLPIILVTAYTDHETIRRAERSGVLGYLVKPVQPESLQPTINIAMARFAELQSLRQEVDALQESLEARKLIERAKGILVQRLQISEQEAYDRLRQRAREKRCKMKDVAKTIIEAEALLS